MLIPDVSPQLRLFKIPYLAVSPPPAIYQSLLLSYSNFVTQIYFCFFSETINIQEQWQQL